MTTHGLSKTITYRSWKHMWSRARGTENKARRKDYCDRGITVCDRWKDFTIFLTDMGYRPSLEYSIDRIDVNGNYTKSNCRWATNQQQKLNQRINKRNTSGVTGVHYIKSTNKWRARFIGRSLGCFHCKEDAKAVYDRAKSEFLKSL